MPLIVEDSRISLLSMHAGRINRKIKSFDPENYAISEGGIEATLASQNIAVARKKEKIAKKLTDAIIHTFGVIPSQILRSQDVFDAFKRNIALLRMMVIRLRSINHYLEESFLDELGLIKKDTKTLLDRGEAHITKSIRDYENMLSSDSISMLEHFSSELKSRLANIDSALVSGYRKKQVKVQKQKKAMVKGLWGLLKKQSELLCHIEAKLPPKKHITRDLLRPENFGEWVSRIVALSCTFAHEHEIERSLLSSLNKGLKRQKALRKSIRSMRHEKHQLLRKIEIASFKKGTDIPTKEHHFAARDLALIAKV